MPSILKAQYRNKYRYQKDALALFIEQQCTKKDGQFDYDKLFTLAADNGIDPTISSSFMTIIALGKHGAKGRCRMTLRNIMAGTLRRQGWLRDLQGNKVELELNKKDAA